MYISKGVYFWLIISSIIVIFDGAFILLRPETLPGGKYSHIYAPYQLYIQFDALYADLKDHFVVIIAYLNLVEVTLTFLSVFISMVGSQKWKLRGAILAIMASAFVFWKTVLYMWYDW